MLCTVLLAISIAAGAAPPQPPSQSPSQSAQQSSPQSPRPAETLIALATSDDHLQYMPTGDVLVPRGSAPTMVRLENGELLAVFEHPGDKPDPSGIQLHASRSKDDGKSWTPPRPVRIASLPDDLEARSPTLTVMPSGLVRMYFVTVERIRAKGARARQNAAILSAVTRDGAEYQLDRSVRLPLKEADRPRVWAYQAPRGIILLAQPSSREGRPAPVLQFTSPDGRSFSAERDDRQPGPVGPVIQIAAQHYRMFLSAGQVVFSRTSSDALRWRTEAGERLTEADEPAIAMLSSKKSLMLFTRPARASDSGAKALAALAGQSGQNAEADPSANAPTDHGGPTSPTDATAGTAEGAGGPVNNVDGNGSGQAAGHSSDSTGGLETGGFEPFSSADYAAELGAGWSPQSGVTDSSQRDDEGFAPLPDFRNKFDYIAWFEAQAMLPPDQNAYSSYEAVRTAIQALPEGALKDRYNAGELAGPPIAWDPSAYPVWESSYQAQHEVLATLQAAAHDPRPYALEPTWPDDVAPEDRRLWSMLLPSLAQLRRANRANLSQAWRMEDGAVPPEQMREAISTGVGLASHLQQGPTLIERLVGVANRVNTLEEARWALHRGVFGNAEEIEATLNTLKERDIADPDPTGWIRFEHAATMDIAQYLCEPTVPGGEPAVRQDRVQMLMRLAGQPQPDEAEEYAITLEDVAGLVRANDAYLRELKHNVEASWPYSMPETSEDLALRHMGDNPLAQMFIPSVDRALEMGRRAEAGRRATQLAYSIELHRLRNGRYPTSLDELPYEQTHDIRTDPFSGTDFNYRLTHQGPLLYSSSINGLDDGGVHSHHWGDRDRKTESDDYVFWPPQK